jgi:hypothetical protein
MNVIEDGHHSILNPKRIILLEYLVFSIAATMVAVGFQRNIYVLSVITVANLYVNGLAVYSWIKTDSLERDIALPSWFVYVVLFFGVLALIWYLFKSRGFPEGLKSTGFFVLYIIGVYAAVFFVAILVVLAMLPFTGIPKTR